MRSSFGTPLEHERNLIVALVEHERNLIVALVEHEWNTRARALRGTLGAAWTHKEAKPFIGRFCIGRATCGSIWP